MPRKPLNSLNIHFLVMFLYFIVQTVGAFYSVIIFGRAFCFIYDTKYNTDAFYFFSPTGSFLLFSADKARLASFCFRFSSAAFSSALRFAVTYLR